MESNVGMSFKQALIIFAFITVIIVLLVFVASSTVSYLDDTEAESDDVTEITNTVFNVEEENKSFLAETLPDSIVKLLDVGMTDSIPSQLLRRKAYVTSYNRETRCPNWVAWRLTGEHTDGPYNRKGVPYYDDDGIAIGIGRVTEETQKGDYFADMECEEPRQSLYDWSTEYNMSHGHMCPAGDNRWDKEAMNQSFLLTNMCPQDRKLNGGWWQKLEDKCRSWARRYGEVWIVAGPIFREGVHRRLGDIMIPEAFFKVVLCMKGEPRAIGFVYENTSESQSMAEQACTVDDIERITDYDFFSALPDSIEQRVEAMGDFGGAM